jgi:NADPH:quinone reductase-like Zn-dependent oxidoreductase
VIHYTREDFTDRPERYDLIVDTAGRRSLSRVRRALTPRGTLVIVGGEGGGRLTGGFERQVRALLLSRFVSQRLVPLAAVDRRVDLLFLKDVIEAGKLTPVIGQTFALGDAAHALTDAEEGHGSGKKVIVMM